MPDAGVAFVTSRQTCPGDRQSWGESDRLRLILPTERPQLGAARLAGMSSAELSVGAAACLEIDEVLALYDAVGWTAYTNDDVTLRAALAGSSLVVAARRGAQLVGLARVISDGATICYVQDLLVHPDAQRSGVGRALMLAVLERYAGLRQKVLLTDDEPGQRAFYEALGFHESRDLGAAGAGSLRAFIRFD